MVVLEAGAGDSSSVWRKVQPEVAKRTRVCAYDRAGYGFSDPSTAPSDPEHAVSDLDQLLRRARIRQPVVLVGHSLGGLYAELFAATFPHAVAGVVLVDPTGLDDFRNSREIMTEEERVRFRANHEKRLAGYQRCLDLARRGQLAVSSPPECTADKTGDTSLDAVTSKRLESPAYWAAYQSEMTNFYPADHPVGSDSAATLQVRARPMALGDRPLVLLRTPGRAPPGERGARLRAASEAAAERLVSTSTRGRILPVASGHYVQLEQPQAVVDAIGGVIDQVRGTSR